MSYLDHVDLPGPHASAEARQAVSVEPTIALVGGYPPRRCGIATYTSDLHHALCGARATTHLFAAEPGGDGQIDQLGVLRFDANDPTAYLDLAEEINRTSNVAILQHEFGIYGGDSGRYFLLLLRQLEVPAAVVMHTVPASPHSAQIEVIQQIVENAASIVVMSKTAARTLIHSYGAPPRQVHFVPHGVPDAVPESREESKAAFGWQGRRVALTFGLLSPGKGIEYAIEAVRRLAPQHPDLLYVLAGQTHPNVRRQHGERYRESLMQSVAKAGIGRQVEFIDRFLDLDELRRMLNACDIYVTPSLEPGQITSGTLSYAVGAGRAVVSTQYVHACELLGDGTGRLVPFRDAGALAAEIGQILHRPEHRVALERRAVAKAETMRWSQCGARFLDLAIGHLNESRPRFRTFAVQTRVDLSQLLRLTDAIGVIQHAKGAEPDMEHGYCTDDNARVLTLAQSLQFLCPENDDLRRLESTALRFLADSWNEGRRRFRNFRGANGLWMEEVGSEESQARAVAALARSARWGSDQEMRTDSLRLAEIGLRSCLRSRSVRAMGNLLCAVADLIRLSPRNRAYSKLGERLCRRLNDAMGAHNAENWPWLERCVTYDNGKIAEGLLRFGGTCRDPEALLLGSRLLRWLDALHTGPNGIFQPVGCAGFYAYSGRRAVFDQQPIEVASMILAYQAAHEADGHRRWLEGATRAITWFYGNNVLGKPVADAAGAYDGLTPDGANGNRGAESTWAGLMAHTAYTQMREPIRASLTPL